MMRAEGGRGEGVEGAEGKGGWRGEEEKTREDGEVRLGGTWTVLSFLWHSSQSILEGVNVATIPRLSSGTALDTLAVCTL